MAASAMAGFSCLQLGPRQGVYCRPSVVLSAVPGGGYQQQYVAAGGGRLKWRLSQFKSPETSYRLRARTDAEALPPDNIPQIAGRIIERPSSAASHQRATQRPPPKMTKSHSSCSLLHNISSGPLSSMQQHMPQQTTVGGVGKMTRTSSGTSLPERHRKSNTAPVFSVQACSVTIQSRPLTRFLTTPPKKIAPPEEPFPYPDPVRVGGDHAFNIRLTEMAGLQRETAKIEECRARIARRNAAANTAGASTATTSTASSLQSNQSSTRPSTAGVSSTLQSVRPSSGVSRVSSRTGLSRRTSLPAGHATTVQDKPPPLLSGSTTDRPIVRKTSSPLFSISECKSATNSGEFTKPSSTLENPIHAASASGSASKLDTSSSERDIVEKKIEATEGGGSNVDEGPATALEITAVPEREEVIPSSHHRDLVEAIFSRAETQKQSPTTVSTPGGTTEMNNDSIHNTSQTETSGTGSSSTAKVARESKPSSTRSKSSKTNNSSPKQLQKETLPPSTPVSPTSSGVSPPSSPSSSSITSDQSPRPASSNSSKKAHSKSSKTRKSHKKSHGKHNKNT